MPAKKKRLRDDDTHIFTARIPERLWQGLVRRARAAGTSINAELAASLRYRDAAERNTHYQGKA